MSETTDVDISRLIDELQGPGIAGASGAQVGRVRRDQGVALLRLLLQGREPGLAVVQAGLVEGPGRDGAAGRDAAGAATQCGEGLLGAVRHSEQRGLGFILANSNIVQLW